MKRKAFTLIELLVAISILSIMMIFLYQSYASLNKSNRFYGKEVLSLAKTNQLKKIIFMDFSLVIFDEKYLNILNQDTKKDVVFFQSSHSLHKNYNPYIAYIVNDSKLFRLESLKPFTSYPLNSDTEYSVDYLGSVERFRVFVNTKSVANSVARVALVNIKYSDKNKEDILLKIKALNEY